MLQANHNKMTILESKSSVSGCFKAKQRVVPVVHTSNRFGNKLSHGIPFKITLEILDKTCASIIKNIDPEVQFDRPLIPFISSLKYLCNDTL